jgi:hypothetical protein
MILFARPGRRARHRAQGGKELLLPRNHSAIVLGLELVLGSVFRRGGEILYVPSVGLITEIDNDNDDDWEGRPYILRRRMA